ncbi:RNA polymerase subunit sigma-24 [Cellulomonas sp. zg-ZUI199]|uniref:RNA polymerase subunit sigma-24 n=1 Tax=Cellulomonas wangleii TaxID=2816956 RepID=A0ABX8D567_9CELL|nr:RNA polymerase subunit sigma-24 [Cellulomonas wangleii]QVI62595.1 RNA polymerase subunit sigma-24 [Cellulomonas wangleii]
MTPGPTPPPRPPAGPPAGGPAAGDVPHALGDAWRAHWSHVVALLVAQFGSPDLAEDAAGDAFEAAARTWPRDGVPANPGAWLLTAARRRVLDRLRSQAVHRRKEPLMVVDDEMRALAAATHDPGAHVADEQLRLVLACCHPALAPADRVAMTLRFVVGLGTADIARLQLVQHTAMSARLTRAKKRLAATGVPFVVPPPGQLAERLDAVSTVLYLLFTAGYQPADVPGGLRVDLADEAVRLTRELDRLLGGSPRVHALLALMLLQHSRRDARLDDDGRLVLLPDQDRSRWHHDDIAEAVGLLRALPPLDGLAEDHRLQALAAAEHATAPTAADTRWDVVARLYAVLETRTGSPVVRLARAVAVAEAAGPEAGLAVLDGLGDALAHHHRLPAVRGELLLRAGRGRQAVDALERALALVPDTAERHHLETRLAQARDLADGQARDPGHRG